MRWTEGHIWVADDIRISELNGDPTYFMYKYTLQENGKHLHHEKGLDRIADLKLLKPSYAISEYEIEMVGSKQRDNSGRRLGN